MRLLFDNYNTTTTNAHNTLHNQFLKIIVQFLKELYEITFISIDSIVC